MNIDVLKKEIETMVYKIVDKQLPEIIKKQGKNISVGQIVSLDKPAKLANVVLLDGSKIDNVSYSQEIDNSSIGVGYKCILISNDAFLKRYIVAVYKEGQEVDQIQTGFEELASYTLDSTGNSITVNFTPRKHLLLIADFYDSGGTINVNITFNGDTAANYARRASNNGGADATVGSVNAIRADAGTRAANIYVTANILNQLALEKEFKGDMMDDGGAAGAATAPNRQIETSKWANTTAQISSITCTNTGVGTYDIGSSIKVLGKD